MCLQHDGTYGDFNNLPRRTASDKVLRDKAFNIAKNPNFDGYQHGLASMAHKFFDKNSSPKHVDKSATDTETGKKIKTNFENQHLAAELYKPIIKKFERLKVHSSFKDNILGAHLADMQLISKYNK